MEHVTLCKCGSGGNQQSAERMSQGRVQRREDNATSSSAAVEKLGGPALLDLRTFFKQRFRKRVDFIRCAEWSLELSVFGTQ